MSDTKDMVEHDIYPHIDIAAALGELNPRGTGNSFSLDCPACGERGRAFIYKGGKYITCNRREKCGYSEGLWNYIQQRDGFTQQETLQALAKYANYSLADAVGYDYEASQKKHTKADILNKAMAYFQTQLFTGQGDTTLKYLTDVREYTSDEVRGMELGHYPGYGSTEKHLLSMGYEQSDIKAAIKFDMKHHTVVIPYRDPNGNIICLYGRLARPPKEKENKYMPFTEATGVRDTLFNIHTTWRQDTLIVVEGYFDALISSQKGIKGVAAVGQGSLRDVQLDDAVTRGARNIILALDQDVKAGPEGTERAIKRIEDYNRNSKTPEPIHVYVASWDSAYKDPDDLMREKGNSAFSDAIKDPARAAEWMINRKLDKSTESKIDEDKVYRAAIQYTGQLTGADKIHALSAIAAKYDYPQSVIEDDISEYVTKLGDESLKRKIKSTVSNALSSLDDKPFASLHLLKEKISETEIEYYKIRAVPSKPLHEYLKEKYERDCRRGPDDLLGYPLNGFKKLAKHIDGIQPGFYIIGAHSSFGKTAILSNLFLDILITNSAQGIVGLYFTFDDNRDTIINRLVGIISGKSINNVQRPGDNKEIETAYKTLEGFSKQGQLDIKDISEINHIDRLELEIRERSNDKLFVCIDALFDLAVGSDYGDKRAENIDRASKVKALVDTYQIPVICTGELRKRDKKESQDKEPTIHDIMETGKFAYKANCIWLLHPNNYEDFEADNKPILKLIYGKNKLSAYKKTEFLAFEKETSKITETTGTYYS